MDSVVGKIHSVFIKNFVTYDEVKVYPGKYLNLILGPNGTGKSTIVAAIVLGMGGEPKLLSRSTDIRDYIKNGKTDAEIAIKIYADAKEKTTCFRRAFDASGKSSYKVDGSAVTHNQYVKSIAKYNIQIGNLCQFMPQDRVQDFAKMNSQELLNNTQEAICTPDMIQRFEKLKELRNLQRNADKNFQDNQKRLKELEARNAKLESVLEKIKIREKFLDEITIGEKKRICLQFDEIKKDYNNMKELLQKAQSELDRDENAFKNVQNLTKDVFARRKSFSDIVKDEGDKVTNLAKKLDKLEEKLNEHEAAIQQSERDLKSKKSDMAERESEISNANRLLEGYIQDLKTAVAALGTDFKKQLQAYSTEAEAKKKEILHLTEKRSDLNHEIDRSQPELTAIRNRLNKMQNEGERRLAKLRQLEGDVYSAVMWLRGNSHLFAGHVYEPMILELSVKEAKNAVYVENTVSKRDLLAFTCTQKSDVNLLIQKLCNEQKLRINVLHSDEAEYCEYSAEEPISSLRKYGFHSYLLDLLEGPAPILNYLCNANAIHKVVVGTDEVERHVESLPRNINMFYSSRNRFRIVISRYSGEASSTCSRISEMNLLCTDIDVQQVNEQKARLYEITRKTDILKNSRNDIESTISNINEQVNQVKEQKVRLEGRLHQIHEKKRKVKYHEDKIFQLKNTKIDIPAEEEKFKKFCTDQIEKMLQVQAQIANNFKQFERSKIQKSYAEAKLHVYQKETVDVENQLKTAEDEYKTTNRRFESLKKTENGIRNRYNQKEREVLEQCNGLHRHERKFPYTKQFKELPDSLQELEERLVEIKTRADCMSSYEIDIADYENRKKEIQQLLRLLNNVHEDQLKLSWDMKEIHDIWHPYFTEKISIINQNFSRFMSLLEYAGEINIIHNDPMDYDTYGIQILVQYRNTAQLQALDRFIQSGGERAVAIAMYSMSLQNLTHVPFRCVDEINQGMDPGNERKVFNLIVDETCKIGSSQYFFITPKLLPGLHHNDLMNFLIVFNGNLSSPDVFNGRS